MKAVPSRNGVEMLTPQMLADRWGMAVGTLNNWRSQRTGPPFVRISAKRILYRLADIEAFEKAAVVRRNRK